MMPERPIDLDMLSSDIAEALDDEWYDLNVSAADVRRAIVPFIDAIAPGRLTDEQRFFGVGG
jgi:hypothetical protein